MKLNKILLAPEGMGAEAAPESGDFGDNFSETPPQTPQEVEGGESEESAESGEQAQQQTPQQIVATLTEEQLQRLIQKAAKGDGTEAAAESSTPSQPMSPEDYEKLFNVVRVSDKDVEVLLDPDTSFQQKAEALQGLLHNTAKMAATISAYQMALLREQLQKSFEPALRLAQSQQEQQLAQEFLSTYPDMKGYEPLLVLIRDALVKEGAKFNSKEEAFKAVYERAQAVLKRLPGGPGGTSAQPKGGAAKPKMSMVSGGGGVGKAGTPKLTPAEKLARELFD